MVATYSTYKDGSIASYGQSGHIAVICKVQDMHCEDYYIFVTRFAKACQLHTQ